MDPKSAARKVKKSIIILGIAILIAVDPISTLVILTVVIVAVVIVTIAKKDCNLRGGLALQLLQKSKFCLQIKLQ